MDRFLLHQNQILYDHIDITDTTLLSVIQRQDKIIELVNALALAFIFLTVFVLLNAICVCRKKQYLEIIDDVEVYDAKLYCV